jgi:predicted oxidoreductase (fatty acid repression mutant protein)
MDEVKAQIAYSEVTGELRRALALYPRPFNSPHEGYAILREEVDELWDEVKQRERSKVAMRKEAKQVAAMAIQFMMDCT